MSDQKSTQSEPLVTKDENADPEYQKLMAAYRDNPFHDITKDAIAEYVKKNEDTAVEPPAETPLKI